MKTIEDFKNGFEQTDLFKSFVKLKLKPYFRIGHYWIDGDDAADKFLCGAWEMYQELNK